MTTAMATDTTTGPTSPPVVAGPAASGTSGSSGSDRSSGAGPSSSGVAPSPSDPAATASAGSSAPRSPRRRRRSTIATPSVHAPAPTSRGSASATYPTWVCIRNDVANVAAGRAQRSPATTAHVRKTRAP